MFGWTLSEDCSDYQCFTSSTDSGKIRPLTLRSLFLLFPASTFWGPTHSLTDRSWYKRKSDPIDLWWSSSIDMFNCNADPKLCRAVTFEIVERAANIDFFFFCSSCYSLPSVDDVGIIPNTKNHELRPFISVVAFMVPTDNDKACNGSKKLCLERTLRWICRKCLWWCSKLLVHYGSLLQMLTALYFAFWSTFPFSRTKLDSMIIVNFHPTADVRIDPYLHSSIPYIHRG